MRNVFLILLLITTCSIGDEAKIISKFTDPKSCSECHQEQYGMWHTSVHANSHEEKDELYRKTVEYTARELGQPYETTLVSCGHCHNPRLEIKHVDENFMIAKTFEIETEQIDKVENALGATHIKNGISCYICHNVNSLKERHTTKEVGYKLINWVGDDTIVGPFEDPHQRALPDHKSASRDFFNEGNELCLICHQGLGNENEFALYNTGEEHISSQDQQRCIDCHMSPVITKILALNTNQDKAVKRDTRSHLFASVRNNPNLLRNAVSLDFKESNGEINLELSNTISHNLPSGFSGRSLVVKVNYLKNGSQINSEEFEIRARYISKRGRETLAYSAQKLESDTRLKAFETRVFPLNKSKMADEIQVEVVYYLLAPSMHEKIGITEEKFTKAYLVAEKNIKLH